MFRECLEASKDKQYLGINFEEDALATYKEITKESIEYVDADLYSPLLYRFWGDFLKNKKVISEYSIDIVKEKDYRYVLNVCYDDNKHIKLGSDSLLSIGKSEGEDILMHRFAGGFILWPSHRGGINFRKNRYNDDIFLTLDDISKYYSCSKYEGVIPEIDFEWFNYLKTVGDFFDIFFLNEYEKYRDNLLGFEKHRTEKIIDFFENK